MKIGNCRRSRAQSREKLKINKNLVLVFVILFSLVAATAYTLIGQNQKTAEAAWYDYSWQFKKKITIDHTKVGETLTDFPVLINLDSDADLAAYAQDDGDDIVFTLADETTKLSHEIELFDGDAGQLVAWVKVPSLSNAVDTELYLYYGNSSATDQQNGTDVWSNGYAGVWHLSDSGGPVQDSSGNDNNAQDIGGVVYGAAGKINAATTHNTGKYFDAGDKSNLEGMPELTISVWVNPGTIAENKIIVDKVYSSAYRFHVHNGNLVAWINNVSLVPDPIIPLAIGEYAYTSLTYNSATNEVYFYKNASPNGPYPVNGNPVGTNSTSFKIAQSSTSQSFTGSLDELRISSTARSASWISTEYANQNSPSTFYALEGAVEREAIAPTNPTTFKIYSSSSKTIEYQSTDWLNAPSPYFEWSGAGDEGGSGVDGYYLYLGTDPAANPELTSGIINSDNSPYYTTGTNFTLSEPMTEDTTYYFRIKTMDQAYNISDPSTTFTYSFETQVPDPPDFINVSPAGCSTSPSFSFSWLAPSDNGDSGILDYQYKKGANGEISSTPLLTLSETSYQDSDNVLYLRSRDRAGNVSTWQTAVYCSIEAPRIIEGPFVTPNPSSLIVSWRSSKETTSHIEVYDGNTYLSEFGRNTLSIEHSVTVLGLKAEKSYRYRLSWKDSGNNLNYSDCFEMRV